MLFNIINLGRSGHNAIVYWLLAQNKKEKYIGQGQGDYTDRHWRNFTIDRANINTVFTLQNRDIDFDANNLNEIKNCVNDKNKIIILDNCLTQGNHFKTLPNNFPISLEQMINIIVIRDWYNNLASLITMTYLDHPSEERIKNWQKIWTEQAKEAANITNQLPNKYVILYNKWIKDENYRKKICKDLGLEFTDIGFNEVSNHGGGSSFDNNTYRSNAKEMKVLERYKMYINNSNYLSAINDEIIQLNIKLFKFYAFGPFYDKNPKIYKICQKFLEKFKIVKEFIVPKDLK